MKCNHYWACIFWTLYTVGDVARSVLYSSAHAMNSRDSWYLYHDWYLVPSAKFQEPVPSELNHLFGDASVKHMKRIEACLQIRVAQLEVMQS